jgi:uncharacterized protein (TIGR03437 family)
MQVFFPHERPANLYWIFCWHGGGYSVGLAAGCMGNGNTSYSPVSMIQRFLDTPNPVGGKGIGIIEADSLLAAPGVNTFPVVGWQSPKCAVWYALANQASFGGNWNIVGNYGPSAGGSTAWWVGQTSDTLYPPSCPTPPSRPPGGYRTAAAWPPTEFGLPLGNSFIDHTDSTGVSGMYNLLNANSTATVRSQDMALNASPILNITQANYAFLSQPLMMQFGDIDTIVKPTWNSGAGGNSVEAMARYAALNPPLTPVDIIYPNCGHECDLQSMPFAPTVVAAFDFLVGAGNAAALPHASSVVNGASFQAGIAPETWVTLGGSALSDTTRSWTSNDFVDGNPPVSLDGVSVTINGKPAYVAYISPKQVNVLAPADTTRGAIPVVIRNAHGSGTAINAVMSDVSPALFLLPAGTGKFPVITHADYSLVGPVDLMPGLTRPASPGETIVLWGTGFSATGKLSVSISGQPGTISFAGVVSPGLYQINVKVPNLPSGNAALTVDSGGVASPLVPLAIQQ